MNEITETIYEFNEQQSQEELEQEFFPYFNDVFFRKRGNLFYNDFRSIIVVLPNRCAAKACERYGMATHNHSAINLIRYFNGNNFYFPEEDEKNSHSYIHEQKIVREEALNFKISASSITLLVNIELPVKINEFQLRIFRVVIDHIKHLKKQHAFSKYEINIWDYNGKHIYSSDNDREDKVLSDNYGDQLIDLTIQSKK
ncbi:MAG: hypothetical protein J6X02_02185 [Bacilli bacterium]|nr:hypothetical protein [Bacilli bacterium]